MHIPLRLISAMSVVLFFSLSCGKGGNTTPVDPCRGVTITVTAIITNASAPGLSNGSLTVSASGGTGFTYSLNGAVFQSSASFLNLPAGAYTVTAKNSNGCSGTENFSILANNPCAGITITVTGVITNPTAPGVSDGTITASATGSSGFTYSLDGGTFQANGNFTGISGGLHMVTAKDLNGCTGSANFTLVAPNPCAGVNIIVTGTTTNPTSAASANGSINASATGSTGFTFSLNNGTFQASGNFTGLSAGNFTVTAKDANGCSNSANFTLTAPNPCAGVTIQVTNAVTGVILCQSPPSGSITATPSGGTGPYTFSLNAGSFQASNIFSGLIAGSYAVNAKDANGCIGSNNASIINLPMGPLFSAVKSLLQTECVSCHNASNANGGMNWTVDCNIVSNSNRIKVRAVDGIPSPMPPSGLLPSSERQKITNWILAGGRYTD